jgi:tetratricopeptide (TPR) repeat protein
MNRRAAALILAAAVARADSKSGSTSSSTSSSTFDAAYQSGQDLFHLGKYAEAHQAFARARALAPHLPGPYRWLGRTERVLERWEDCVTSSTEAVRLKPDSPLVAQVREDIEACRSALGRPGYGGKLSAGQGVLAVIVDVEGARLKVDGIDRGPTPVSPFPLNAGAHIVRIEAPAAARELQIAVIPAIVVDAVIRLHSTQEPK